MAAMNQVRFGSFGEFGHSHLYANRVNAQIRQYGLFHYAFLERNLHDAFTRLPEIRFHPLRIGFNGEGMSLFVTTPLLLYLLWPKEKPRLHRALWITVALVAIPGFFYQNSGYYQFGFRFSLDYTPYLIVLLALGARPFNGLFWTLAFASVAVNTWGAAVFNRLY
jgi:phosphoglycerol transferase MdoB-like AlkP superfamily enzyme